MLTRAYHTSGLPIAAYPAIGLRYEAQASRGLSSP
jgi:hypothetical protein